MFIFFQVKKTEKHLWTIPSNIFVSRSLNHLCQLRLQLWDLQNLGRLQVGANILYKAEDYLMIETVSAMAATEKIMSL